MSYGVREGFPDVQPGQPNWLDNAKTFVVHCWNQVERKVDQINITNRHLAKNAPYIRTLIKMSVFTAILLILPSSIVWGAAAAVAVLALASKCSLIPLGTIPFKNSIGAAFAGGAGIYGGLNAIAYGLATSFSATPQVCILAMAINLAICGTGFLFHNLIRYELESKRAAERIGEL